MSENNLAFSRREKCFSLDIPFYRTNYAQPGDRMTLTFDTAARKIVSLNINTYMGESKDTVTLQVQMASLPDGTNYAQQTVLDASAKKLQVTTSNSNYQKLGGS